MNDREVADYLLANPEFFGQHAELLATIRLANPHGKAAISLQERQMEMLRDKNKHLERRLAEKRVYPSINLNKSGTRREEMLIKPEILQKIWVLRKFIHDMDEVEAMEFLLDKIRQTKSNSEFFDLMRRGG